MNKTARPPRAPCDPLPPEAQETHRPGRDEDVWTPLFYTGLPGSVILTAVVPFYLTPLCPKAIALLCRIGGARWGS